LPLPPPPPRPAPPRFVRIVGTVRTVPTVLDIKHSHSLPLSCFAVSYIHSVGYYSTVSIIEENGRASTSTSSSRDIVSSRDFPLSPPKTSLMSQDQLPHGQWINWRLDSNLRSKCTEKTSTRRRMRLRSCVDSPRQYCQSLLRLGVVVVVVL
jgi:hypothetical protein